jgi:hypothetical protein
MQDMTQPFMPLDALNLAFQFVAMAFALAPPLFRLVRTRRFWHSFFSMWLYLLLWVILFCFLIPVTIRFIVHKDLLAHFPDGSGIPAMLMIGWLPCLILCTVTYIVAEFWEQIRQRLKSPN